MQLENRNGAVRKSHWCDRIERSPLEWSWSSELHMPTVHHTKIGAVYAMARARTRTHRCDSRHHGVGDRLAA